MTRVSGYTLNAAPCCGFIYGELRYSSMNFGAWENWTDGYRRGSLMPNDQGLRRCRCGAYFLTTEMVCVGQSNGNEDRGGPSIAPVVDAKDLPKVLEQPRTPGVELAARIEIWHLLNHPYRDLYRAHRKAEEEATRAEWEVRHPDRRTWWQKFRHVPPPEYKRPLHSPFTFPPFQPSLEQTENMRRILSLLELDSQRDRHAEALAEVHRELQQFAEARQALKLFKYQHQRTFERVMIKLINARQSAPVCFSY